MNTHLRATLAGVAAIVLWAALALMTSASGTLPPFQLLATTFGVAGALGVLLLIRHGGLRRLRQPLAAGLLATAALFGYHALYFFALKRAPVVEANLINYLWPLLIVLFAAVFTREPVHAGQWLGTLLGLAGAALVVTRGEQIAIAGDDLPGYLAALGAALVWSAYSVLNRRYAAVDSSAIVGPCLLTALCGALAHLRFEATVTPDAGQWLVMLAMGAGPVGAAFWLWDASTKRGDLALLGMLSYAAPLLSTVLLVAFGRAPLHWTQAAAVALLLLGAAVGLRRPTGRSISEASAGRSPP